jgi:regulation of enolase protein 1 (concanavalin A-like superfamily)
VTAVDGISITITTPEHEQRVYEVWPDGIRRWTPQAVPALPPRRFAVSETLAAGKVPMEVRLLPGRQPGTVPVPYMYRLTDVRVGDWVSIACSRVDGVDVCDHICIRKRPGGWVPPLPEEVKETTSIRYHERVNAHWDLLDFGIPYPEKFRDRRFPVAPMPRALTPDAAPPPRAVSPERPVRPTRPAVRPPEVPEPPGVAGIPPPRAVAPVPTEEALAKLDRAYGTWVNPDRDCAFKLTGGRLTISVPATDHLIGRHYETTTDNAPRTWREVEGDFTAVVRVTIPIPGPVPGLGAPRCGGGLVAWESNQGYATAQLCGGWLNGSPEGVRYFRARPGAHSLAGWGFDKPTGTGFVQIKRRGSWIRMGYSRDGKAWRETDLEEVTWGPKVKVGVVVENDLGKPVEVTFDQFELTQPKQ